MFKRVQAQIGIVRELMVFLWQRRLWWLIPMVIMLLLVGILLVLVHGSTLAPFLYPFF